MRKIKKSFFIIGLFAFLCAGCSLYGNGGSKTTYNVRFNLATAGNCLNVDIYHPDNGPSGFVSYRSYFSSCYVTLDYDSNAIFSCTYTNGGVITKNGSYTAGVAGNGNLLSITYSNGELIRYYWPNYYQFYATETFDLPGLGPTAVTILYHATVIFG